MTPEAGEKPLSIALREINEGKLVSREASPEELAQEEALAEEFDFSLDPDAL